MHGLQVLHNVRRPGFVCCQAARQQCGRLRASRQVINMLEAYTMGGKIPYEEWYFKQRYSGQELTAAWPGAIRHTCQPTWRQEFIRQEVIYHPDLRTVPGPFHVLA